MNKKVPVLPKYPARSTTMSTQITRTLPNQEKLALVVSKRVQFATKSLGNIGNNKTNVFVNRKLFAV